MNDITFEVVRSIINKVESGKTSEAVAELRSLDSDIMHYEQTVNLVLGLQEDAATTIKRTHTHVAEVVRATVPKKINDASSEAGVWLHHFSRMCEELCTDNFEDVNNGKVYMEHEKIMLKGDTLVAYMSKHYHATLGKYHLNTMRTLFDAKSSSVSRDLCRERVWTIQPRGEMPTTSDF